VKKLIETIVSEVVNVLKRQGYSTNESGSGIVVEQYPGMSGGAGGQGKGRGGGRGQGGGGRGGGRGGGGCGGRGNSRAAG
jgi:hypothetical protein